MAGHKERVVGWLRCLTGAGIISVKGGRERGGTMINSAPSRRRRTGGDVWNVPGTRPGRFQDL